MLFLTRSVYVFSDARSGIVKDQIESVKTLLRELISRTKDFENLNAFRLFILQHHTCNNDVDQATKLIKRGKCPSAYRTARPVTRPPGTPPSEFRVGGGFAGGWQERGEKRNASRCVHCTGIYLPTS